MAEENKQVYALVGEYPDTPTFFEAAAKFREAGFKRWDCFTPFPVHGLDGQMGVKRSRVPLFTLLGGFAGFFTGALIVWYMNAYDYPLIVGGKPYFSFVFPFPVMYELTILFAAFGTLLGMFATNLLPRHHHPIFDYEDFYKSGDDTLMIVVERVDPRFPEAAALLEETGANKVVEILA